jgi:uncharacterized protein DUF4270
VNRKLLAPLSFFVLFITICSSCTRIDTTDIGNDLIPVVDNVNTFDTTFDVITDNFLFADSSRVFDTEDHALGVIANDPVFGKLSAGIYFNVSPATFGAYPFIPKDSIKHPIDSVVLSMAFTGIFGDSMSTQTFGIYELQNDARFLDSANGYLIRNQEINRGPLLKTHTQDFDRLSDKYVILKGRDTQTVQNQMRIRLDNSLGERFMNYDTSIYKSDSSFRIAFPGIALIPQSGNQTALAYFNLANVENTMLTIYYKAKSLNGVADSALTTSFTFRNYRNLNKIDRTVSGSEFGTALNPGTPSDEKVYIATSPGSYATIRIPGLQELSNRVIHRAELVATPVNQPGLPYQEPYYLFLDALDTVAGRPKTIQNDFTYNSSSGQYNQTLFGGFLINGKYTWDISRYVQGIVTRKETSYPLRIYAPYKTATVYIPGGVAASYPPSQVIALDTTYKKQGVQLYLNPQIAYGRTVLGGGTHPTSKMRLRIIYSKI